MFDILFGWRKASKCKKVIKQLQCRIKLLKNKRYIIVRQLREDAAELIKYGHEDNAFNRVEQIIKDECAVALYELLDNFCEFILIHLPYIRRHKDCPNDVNEAVSSLIYASARCGDLPELRQIRKLFGDRYGQTFTMSALQLLPGNLVNLQVVEKLSLKSVTDDVKHRLVNEIARNYCIKPEVLAIEYYSEWQQKVKEMNGHEMLEGVDDVSNASAGSSNSVTNQLLIEYNRGELGSPNVSNSGTESRTRDGDILIYFDDVEEVKSAARKDGESQDQRVFKFKATAPKKENLESSCDLSYVDCYETWSQISDSKSTGRSSWDGSAKRPRKMPVFQENPCYFRTRNQNNFDCGVQPWKQKRGITTRVGFPGPEDPMVYNVFTYPDHQQSNVTNSWTARKERVPPYFRAVTMPPERLKNNQKEDFQRSYSDACQSPTHVHPKLPDYDDIAAKFMALKRERLQNVPHCSNKKL